MNQSMLLSLVIVGVLLIILGILRLRHVSPQGLVFGLVGAILGLSLGALASVPLGKLPQPLGDILPLAATVVLTISLIVVVQSHRSGLIGLLPFMNLDENRSTKPADHETITEVKPELPQILVDTSVIIDGRIADIAAAGFVPGRLVVPHFVLAELQNIADSEDAMRRGRGRRGLEVLGRLRDMPDVDVSIIDDDVPSIREVDAKLVALGQQFACNVLTTDYNLNRVAQIQGVRVLNVNELSNAIRPVVLPGEELVVRVVQPGKERNQGVGYLADGTMIVVESGDKLIGQEVSTEVTRVFQTVAGKMIFATPRKTLSSVEQTTPTETRPPKPASSTPQTPAQADTAGTEQRPRTGRNRKQRSSGNGSGNSNANGNGGQHAAAPKHDNRPSRGNRLEENIIAATNNPRNPGQS